MGLRLCDVLFMRALCLVTEAFGGKGGIAQYNKDLLVSLCNYSRFTEIVAITRLSQGPISALPANLTYVTPGPSKIQFIKAALGLIKSHMGSELIVCGHINLLPIAYVLSFFTRAPLVLLIYGIDVWQKHESRMVNLLLSHVTAFISISEITLEKFFDWSRLSSHKAHVLPNAIDLTKYRPGPKSLQLLERYKLTDKTVLMTVGRISADERSKGFDEVVDVLPAILRENSNVVYLIVGEGTDKKRLEAKVMENGLGRQVVFVGFISEEEKVDHFRLADVYVMPSRGEGFGFVFLEALACGVPVIASKIDGGREAIRGGKLGRLVDPDNKQDLIQAILDAIHTPGEIDVKELEYFASGNFEKRLHGIIDQLLQPETRLK